ncbi:MAG: hypothetical protein HQL31_09485 [Planctomycetes bacterium]|nr:hypothetical protein [Planctomycetota bacterium]
MGSTGKACVLTAVLPEAEALPGWGGFELQWRRGGACFYCGPDGVDVLVTGMGPLNASFSCGLIADLGHELWLNAGIAGSLKDVWKLGSVHRIGRTCFIPEASSGELPKLGPILSDSPLTLATVAAPLHDRELRDFLAASADLVDMEGHALALAARSAGKRIAIYKIVSDSAAGETHAEIRASIPRIMPLLYDFIRADGLL